MYTKTFYYVSKISFVIQFYRSTISIFPHKKSRMSEFRVWNAQLVKYAGYKQSDGSVIGDPGSLEMTQV